MKFTFLNSNNNIHNFSLSLGELWNYVGGVEYVVLLLTPLEILSTCEESSVRDKAIATTIKLSTLNKSDSFVKNFVLHFNKLAGKDW